jgi:hypothetical protein
MKFNLEEDRKANKMVVKSIWSLFIIIITICLVIVGLMLFAKYLLFPYVEQECINDVARMNCEENDGFFDEVIYRNEKLFFTCLKNREIQYFSFYPHEIDKCNLSMGLINGEF